MIREGEVLMGIPGYEACVARVYPGVYYILSPHMLMTMVLHVVLETRQDLDSSSRLGLVSEPGMCLQTNQSDNI